MDGACKFFFLFLSVGRTQELGVTMCLTCVYIREHIHVHTTRVINKLVYKIQQLSLVSFKGYSKPECIHNHLRNHLRKKHQKRGARAHRNIMASAFGVMWAVLTAAPSALWRVASNMSTSPASAGTLRAQVGFAFLMGSMQFIVFGTVMLVVLQLISPTPALHRDEPFRSRKKEAAYRKAMRQLSNLSIEFDVLLDTADASAKTMGAAADPFLADYVRAANAAELTALAFQGSGVFSLLLSQTTSYTVNFIRTTVALKNFYTLFLLIAMSATVMNVFTDTVMPVLRESYNGIIEPVFAWIVNPMANVAYVMVGLITYWPVIIVTRFMSILIWTPVTVLFTFAVADLVGYARLLGRAVSTLITGAVFWISDKPSLYNFPLVEPVQALLSFVKTIYVGTFVDSCKLADWILAGIGRTIDHITLVYLIHSTANFPLYSFQALVLQWIMLRRTPQVQGFNELTLAITTNAGWFISNVTLSYVDTFVGNFTGYVNGSIPIPDDGTIYAVRALKSGFFSIPTYIVASFLSIGWELLYIVFNVNEWFRLRGNNFFILSMFKSNVQAVFASIESVVDIAPQCIVPGSGIYESDNNVFYGPIVGALGLAALNLVYSLKDVILGELYTIMEGKFAFFFTAGYFYADGDNLSGYSDQIKRMANSVGCAIGQLDPGVGKFFDGLLGVVLSAGIIVLIDLFAFARYALELQNADIMDRLDESPDSPLNELETEALQISNVATFIYRFENADSQSCKTRLTFLCSLGKVIESFVSIIIRAVILILRSIKNVVKAAVSLLSKGAIGTVTPLNIEGVVAEAYIFGCRVGTLLANSIPIDLPCHRDRPNFCAVFEFNPVPSPQTPTICASTVMCRIGNFLGAGVEIFFILLQFGVNLDFSGDPLVYVLRRILNLAVNKLLSPLCPFGHYIDCWLSTFLPKSDFASRFFCLVNSAAIQFVTLIGETVIRITQLAIYIIQAIFGGITAAGLMKILEIGFDILRSGVEQFIFAVIGTFFGWLVGIIQAVCTVLCLAKGPVCDTCNSAVAAMKGTTSGFFDPDDDSNYMDNRRRKRMTLEEQDWFAGNVSRQLLLAFGMIYNATEYDPNTGEIRTVERVRLFNAENMHKHMATHVRWTTGTPCFDLFRAVNETNANDLGIAENLMIKECIRMKALAVSVAITIPFLSWLPEDIFYNPYRWFSVAATAIRVAIVLLQWGMDRSWPIDVVMSPVAWALWEQLPVNTTHYYNEFADLYPGPNRSIIEYMPLEVFRSNLTYQWYFHRNFPDTRNHSYANSTGFGYESYEQALLSSYMHGTDFLWKTMDMQQNYTALLAGSAEYAAIASGVDPVTNLSLSDGAMYSLTEVYTYNNVSNVRERIFSAYGDEYVTAYDQYLSTQSLFSSMAQAAQTIFNIAGTALMVYGPSASEVDFHELLDNENYLKPTNDQIPTTNTPPAPAAENEPPATPESEKRRKRWAEAIPTPASFPPKHFRRNYVPPNKKPITEAMREATRNLHKRQARVVEDHVPRKFEFEIVTDSIKRSLAKGVDAFMHNNDASFVQPSAKQRRSGIDLNALRYERLQSKSRISRVVIAGVAAASAISWLNTTYTPVWCNSTTDMQRLCATGDWKNAALYIGNNTDLVNEFNALFNSSYSTAEAIFAPRSEMARESRSFVTKFGSTLVQFSLDVYGRLNAAFDSEGVAAAWERTGAAWRAKQERAHAKRVAAGEYQIGVSNNKDELPSPYKAFAPPVYPTVEAQAERYRKWYQENIVVGMDGAPSEDDDERASSWLVDVVDAASIKEWKDDVLSNKLATLTELSHLGIPGEVRVENGKFVYAVHKPGSKARAYIIPEATQKKNATLFSAGARAWQRFLQEENALSIDHQQYLSLFADRSDEDPNYVRGMSTRMYWPKRTIDVRAYTNRRGLYEDITGRPAPPDARLPRIRLHAHKEAVLRPARSMEANAVFSAADAAGRIPGPGQHWEMVSYSPREFSDLQAAAAASSPYGPRIVRDVLKIEFIVPENEDGSAAETIRPYFMFPSNEEEFEDLARRRLGCRLNDTFLCSAEGCILLDQVVGKEFDRIMSGVAFYTGYFPAAFADSAQFLSYTYDQNATARIGYGAYPARYPALGISDWYWFRGSVRETANYADDGPKWEWFFEDMIGSPLPTELMTNGSTYTGYREYLVSKQQAIDDGTFDVFDLNPFYDVMEFVEETLGLPVFQLVDTVIDYVQRSLPELANWAYKRYKCDYAEAIDCSQKLYSYAGAGSLITGATLLAATFLWMVGLSAVAFWLIAAVALNIRYMIAFLGYGWAISCFPILPQCFIKDEFDFWSMTVTPRCLPILGTFVRETDYNLNTCMRTNLGIGSVFYGYTGPAFTDVSCQDAQFKNPLDALEVGAILREVRGSAPDIIDRTLLFVVKALYSMNEEMFGGALPTLQLSRAWRQDDVAANLVGSPQAWSIYSGCAAIGKYQGVGFIGLGATLASNIAIPLLLQGGALLTFLIGLIGNAVAYAFMTMKTFDGMDGITDSYNLIMRQLSSHKLPDTIYGRLLTPAQRRELRRRGDSDDEDSDDDDDSDDDNTAAEDEKYDETEYDSDSDFESLPDRSDNNTETDTTPLLTARGASMRLSQITERLVQFIPEASYIHRRRGPAWRGLNDRLIDAADRMGTLFG